MLKNFNIKLTCILNNIFLQTFKPRTSTLRFLKKTNMLNVSSCDVRFRFRSCIKKNLVRPKGTKLILSKGSGFNKINIFKDVKKTINNQLAVVTSIIKINKNLYSLLKYANGSLNYVKLTNGVNVGDILYTTNLPPYLWYFYKPGMTVMLRFLKKFTTFHSLVLNSKAKYGTSCGVFCQLLETSNNSNLIKIKLPSGQTKTVSGDLFVTVGRVSNINKCYENLGKGGSLKHRLKKPKVRGVAKNPVDHPHGGRTKTNKPEVSPWG